MCGICHSLFLTVQQDLSLSHGNLRKDFILALGTMVLIFFDVIYFFFKFGTTASVENV